MMANIYLNYHKIKFQNNMILQQQKLKMKKYFIVYVQNMIANLIGIKGFDCITKNPQTCLQRANYRKKYAGTICKASNEDIFIFEQRKNMNKTYKFDMDFFQDKKQELEENLYNQLFSALKYEFQKKETVLYFNGQVANKFYIILKGACLLYMLKNTEEDQILQEETEFLKLKEKNDESNDDEFNTFINCCFQNHYQIGKYVQGDSFGDIQITNKQYRIGTAVCSQDCSFVTLSEFFQILLNKIIA
ncbi:hypothetical protein IMG5_168280 [Ichthyophthirius multifiliis]|uniref:Cyclic nucleotide-binding domain-containing protein n=1 Tax=Ichthyophthirius multifiliis TaxID=5932 RepID=G0R125_ICHMU|nr:hypothetical protein IMG5_168280 [Ichthyophthirius multifiliis]EGR28792.1 hypothetical protein IMG5_168280 [Ichthyophthirius multifiliis]|eukprot:XP_004030028.1 hypothetical protein IMG5_168280 [Ichthyophthirius multifiliis]